MNDASFERFCREYRQLIEFICRRMETGYTGTVLIHFKSGEIKALNAQECLTAKQLRARGDNEH